MFDNPASQDLCDVTINVRENGTLVQSYSAHWYFLAAKSTEFAALHAKALKSESEKCDCDVIEVQGVPNDVVKAVLRACYGWGAPEKFPAGKVLKKNARMSLSDEKGFGVKLTSDRQGRGGQGWEKIGKAFGIRSEVWTGGENRRGNPDCVIECEDGRKLSSHKCMLGCRVPYFAGMLNMMMMMNNNHDELLVLKVIFLLIL